MTAIFGTQGDVGTYTDARGFVRTVRIGPDPNGKVTTVPAPQARAVLRQVEVARLPNGAAFQLSVNLFPAPVVVRHQQLGANYSQIDRPGRQPLSVWANQQLEQISFETIIVSDVNPGYDSCEEKLGWLRAMATMPTDVVLAFGAVSNSKRWRITDFNYDSVMRDPTTDYIVRARASFTLTEQVRTAQLVPGFQTIKDIAPPRQQATGSSNPGATTPQQRSTNTNPCTGGTGSIGQCVDRTGAGSLQPRTTTVTPGTYNKNTGIVPTGGGGFRV